MTGRATGSGPQVTALDQARVLLTRAQEQKAARLAGGSGTGGARRVAAPRTTEARVQQALDTAAVDRALPTLPAISDLLAGASLRGGAVYSVRGSTALVMAMMAGPSAEGAWCGVVGMPSFGAEAASALGVDLERLVLVPDPDRDWLSVVAALADALTVVVVRPPGEVTPGEASRLAARLRTRGAMLIAVGSWPGSEARLEIEENSWAGLGLGEGLISARQATVRVTGRGAAVRTRRHRLWLPGPDGMIRTASTTPARSLEPVAGTRSAWTGTGIGSAGTGAGSAGTGVGWAGPGAAAAGTGAVAGTGAGSAGTGVGWAGTAASPAGSDEVREWEREAVG